jgi:hypothetical protein
MVSLRTNWSNIQPTQPSEITNDPNNPAGNWYWTFLDTAIEQVTAAERFIFLRILVQQGNSPSWVQANAQQFVGIGNTTVNVYWDSYYQAAITAMIQAVGARYSGNPNLKIFSCNIASQGAGDWAVSHTTNANWTNSASFTCPAFGSTVSVPTTVNSGMSTDQICHIPDFGWFQCVNVPGPGAAQTKLLNLGTSGNASSGTVAANTTITVSDVKNWTSPVYNYTTANLVNALTNIATVSANAFPNQICTHEVGRNGSLDPYPNSGTTYAYNAATQFAQWGYANMPLGRFAIQKNSLNGGTVNPAAALAAQDNSEFYLLAEAIAGSSNTSGTTGTIPANSLTGGQFTWNVYDITGEYSPTTTGPSGDPYYANGGNPYTNPVPIFDTILSLANQYNMEWLETYEVDVLNIFLVNNVPSVTTQPGIPIRVIANPPAGAVNPNAPTIVKQIKTIGQDRFDLIAQREYGNCTLIGPIIDANLEYANVMFFDAGVTINIPLASIAQQQIAGPPWSELYLVASS